MFGSNATRLARIDWSKYGRMELAGTTEPTNEQLKRAVEGLSVGIQQLAEELANVLGNYDLPLQHRAPFISSNYTPDAPGVSPDEDELDKLFPQIGALANDSWYDPDDEQIKGGLAGFARGAWVLQPAINNPNIIGGNAQNKIVLFGGQGAGACFENIYINNIYDKTTGLPWSGGSTNLPAGSVMLWAGAIGSIPTGWALMDGVANSVGNGGSGINLTGIPYPYISGDPTFGTLGASVSLAFAATISGNGGTTGLTISAHAGSGTITTSESGAHSHTISEAEFDSKVTINTPSLAHTEASAGTIITNVDIWSVDDSPLLAAFDGTTAPDSNFTSSVGEITSAGHNHTIANESIADALADHAAAACTTTFSSALATDSTLDHDHTITGTQVATVLASHTGTVSNNSIASGLSIGTPSTLRPAGTVLAYIEKLAA